MEKLARPVPATAGATARFDRAATSQPDSMPRQSANPVMPRHSLETLNILPAPRSPVDVAQAVRPKKKTNSEKRRDRWVERDKYRRKHGRVPTGQYVHLAGPVGISGMNRQRIAQTNKANYGDQTFGPIPPYSKMRKHLDYPDAERALYDPKFKPPRGLSQQQRMATVLAVTASNVSEGDKIPGIPKLIRALARRHHFNRKKNEHPLDPSVNPAVTTAPKARDLMEGRTALKRAHIDAIDNYASDSSDEDEENFLLREKMLKPKPDSGSPKKKRKK